MGIAKFIEPRRWRAIRTPIAQILEYAVAMVKFSFVNLETLAQKWFIAQRLEFSSLLVLRSGFFRLRS